MDQRNHSALPPSHNVDNRMNIFARAPISLPLRMQEEIRQQYCQPVRFYHTFQHVESLLIQYHELFSYWSNPKEVYLAFVYHDVIYEYGAKDNEEQSALFAQQHIHNHMPQSELNVAYIMSLIRHTANHGHLQREEINEEEQLFLDCDMSILGSSSAAFQEYEQQIEQEYTQVFPKILYRLGRKRFRSRLSKAPRIFFSDIFHQRYDIQARKNLRS